MGHSSGENAGSSGMSPSAIEGMLLMAVEKLYKEDRELDVQMGLLRVVLQVLQRHGEPYRRSPCTRPYTQSLCCRNLHTETGPAVELHSASSGLLVVQGSAYLELLPRSDVLERSLHDPWLSLDVWFLGSHTFMRPAASLSRITPLPIPVPSLGPQQQALNTSCRARAAQ